MRKLWKKFWDKLLRKLFHFKDDKDEKPEQAAKDEIDLSLVVWTQGGEVKDWPIIHKLTAEVGSKLSLAQKGTQVWRPVVRGVVANSWFFTKRSDGKWYGGTFEWIRPNTQELPKREVVRGKLKSMHRVLPEGWEVQSGETYGFMMSGLIRSATRNVSERTQIALAVWR